MQFIAIVKLLTQFLISLPLLERSIKAMASAINEAIADYELKKFQKDLEEAAKKAIEKKDTSDLEKLAGKK
jgi:hypothetical protein